MLPNNSSSQAPDPATLPPVASAVSAPAPQAPAPLLASSPQPAASAVSNIVAQTKQVVAQNQGNPYRLSAALGQLKSQYLAEQFHINTNPGQK